VPEIVFVALDPELARTEHDPEIRDLIIASAGLNLALEYLAGAVAFDPLAEKPDAELASAIVWFDAYVSNVDRSPRNPNLLMWQRQLWLIDHGAALYFHHAWHQGGADPVARSRDRFAMIKDHVLLRSAGALRGADARLVMLLAPDVIDRIVGLIPETWLAGEAPGEATPFGSIEAHREAYRAYLLSRLATPRAFLDEAVRARA
jgi:hypothetical protein